ncbi:CD276 antigen-like isoform X1 [Dicentrarchus labrax]|uniref:Ig-like domain-containing protein n=1 Tax=Dicentrarchus labrax TaxID=13489 RepID=A0A8P4K8E1_DICLA|nr:CD276 antigen-like isoform X1 [Dicentrarchus labrax]
MMGISPLTLCSVLLFVGTVTGEHQAVCPNPTMEAKQGDDVILRCFLEPEFNLSASTVDWSRVDLYKRPPVHVYRSKKDDPRAQMDRYRDRTTLNHKELSRGNADLLISSVQPSDSGSYECYIPKLKVGCTIDLAVEKENQQSTTGPPEEDREPHRKVPVAAVAAGLVVVAAVVVGLIVFLVKRGKIQIG